MTEGVSTKKPVSDEVPLGISPSEFMRSLRPEYYSDTADRAAYELDAATLAFQLDTITERNETHDFELFCRKLCERAICPNLRPQTGPEGGGDSKVDTETTPVSDELSAVFLGDANAGRERWAFAFSAKKSWLAKIRADVKGIVDTGRRYDRIICVTSRAAKAKARAALEDELSALHGLPVTIHDRSWIVKEVIEADRKDLAFNYLRVGKATADPSRLGPADYSRTQQLAEIEKSLDDPETYRGMELQRVSEALVAAKLSRNLERPRTETDGRFVRAIRLANEDGTYHQKLEAQYEQVWTGFWWFDDTRLLLESYDEFAAKALTSTHAIQLEFLSNLHQLLVNCVIHRHLTREECKIEQRSAALRKALEPLASDKERPNNALEAQTLLLIMRVNRAVLGKKPEDLPAIWQGFSELLDSARGLAEYEANRLPPLIDLVGNVAGNDPSYTALVEKLAAFVAERKSEAEGALILLKRAQKLDFSECFDMIRLLGKVAVALVKREYTERLVEALQLLMLAYKSAGLLWASRATCLFALSSIVVEGERASQLPISIVSTMKVWAWIAIEMGHLPDFLYAVRFLNGALVALPLADESKEKVRDDLRELDFALGCLLLNVSDEELRRLDQLPDILEGLGLVAARAAMLYALGYEKELREDGSIGPDQSAEAAAQLFSRLASQPLGKEWRGNVVLNGEGPQTLGTAVLGMTVDISFDGIDHLTVVAEGVLGTLEALFATLPEKKIAAHVECFHIALSEGTDIATPAIKIGKDTSRMSLVWPRDLRPGSFERQDVITPFYVEAVARIVAMTCVMKDPSTVLEGLFANEAVLQRIAMVVGSSNCHQRLTSKPVSRWSSWHSHVGAAYPPREPRPTIMRTELASEEVADDDEAPPKAGEPFVVKDHRKLVVKSVIDLPAWNQACWNGTLYAQWPDGPPMIGMTFGNEEGARRIFGGWRERFGPTDTDEEIYLALIRKVSKAHPYHYIVLVTSNPSLEKVSGNIMTFATRSLTMEPQSDVNIDRFIASYQKRGEFGLMPATVREGKPKMFPELAIRKRAILIKDAAEVGESDIESIALRMREKELV